VVPSQRVPAWNPDLFDRRFAHVEEQLLESRSYLNRGVCLTLWLAVLLCGEPRAQAVPGPDPGGRLGAYLGSLEPLGTPGAAAFAADGRLYLAEVAGHRVAVFSPSRELLFHFGTRGAGPGQLAFPRGLCFAEDGSLLVADTGNDRIQRFSPEGDWLGDWGPVGGREGSLRRPTALLSHAGAVFVADTGNHRVLAFESGGRPREGWLASRTAFLRPAGLAGLPSGSLVVADTGHHQLVVLGPEGGLVQRIGTRGGLPGQFAEPTGLAFGAGRLYVADAANHRVQVYDGADLTGLAGAGQKKDEPLQPIYEWGKHVLRPGDGAGRLHYPDTLALSPDGLRLALCESFADRVQLFGAATGPVSDYAANPLFGTGFSAHHGPCVAVQGDRMLLTEPEGQVALLHDLKGRRPVLVHRLGGWEGAADSFLSVSDVAFAPDGGALIVDRDGGRLHRYRLMPQGVEGPRFDPTLGHLVQVLDLPELLGQRCEPVAVVADGAGLVHIADAAQAVVWTLGTEGRPAVARGAGALIRPVDLAWLPAESSGQGPGRLLVVDAGSSALVVFDLAPTGVDRGRDGEKTGRGATVERWGEGLLQDPAGVAVDDRGRVYVTDRGTHRVLVFGAKGEPLGSWGGQGLAGGRFFKPAGIAWVGGGRLVVIDHGNHRGQFLDVDGGFLRAFGSRLYVKAAEGGG
jgi:tripartite motif-containing protein 71